MAPASKSPSNEGLWVASVAVGLAAALWIGGALSSCISGHGLPRRNLFAGLEAIWRPAYPSRAWHRDVGPAWLYWLLNLITLTASTGFTIFVYSLWTQTMGGNRSDSHAGFAERKEVRKVAGRKSMERRAKTLRPMLVSPKGEDVSFVLGRSKGIVCHSSVEDSLLIVGPPRSGKGFNIVIPMILESKGSVVTTSTRPDNLAVSHRFRSEFGPTAVFDPQGLVEETSMTSSLKWSPLRGCEDPQTAILRAESLVPESNRQGVENGNFWRQQALSVTRCLLHAAAVDGRPVSELYRWSFSPASCKEAVKVLTTNPMATGGWDLSLDVIVGTDPRTRDSIWAMVANAFAPLADPKVIEALSPSDSEVFDPNEFIEEKGTLYLLGTSTGSRATSTFVSALMEDVIETAKRQAAQKPGQRLDPPMSIILDEAANYPLSSLPSLMSDGGGSGLSTAAVLQSLSQGRDRWGKEAMGAIWDSAIVKIIMGGSSNASDLSDLSRLIGDIEVDEVSSSRHPISGTTTSVSSRAKPIMEPSEIRKMKPGSALMLLRSASPILLTLSPWTDRREAKQVSLVGPRGVRENNV